MAEPTNAACLCGGLKGDGGVSVLNEAALETEIAALSRVDSAVLARRSVIVAELSCRRRDAADRLRKAGNMSSREANKAAKTAAGLAELEKTREALERGEIGREQAEQLASRMDKPELAKNVRDNEAALLERAKNEGADEFARTMRKDDIDGSPDDGNTQSRRQRWSRMASMWIDPDTGMHHLFAKFDPVTGARVSANLAAMVDKIWRAENAPGVRKKRQLDQRRADALEALICRGTNTNSGNANGNGNANANASSSGNASTDDVATAGSGPSPSAGPTAPTPFARPAPSTGPTSSAGPTQSAGSGAAGADDATRAPTDQTRTAHDGPFDGDADGQQGFNFAEPVGCSGFTNTPGDGVAPGTGPNDTVAPNVGHLAGSAVEPDAGLAPVPPPPANTQLLVIANLDALQGLLTGGSLPDGTPLSAAAIAKLACDADILPAIFNTAGQPLWLGRKQRLASPAQRAAVIARDQGCIACGAAAEFCQVHHIDWWSNGGRTDIDNLCLLCSRDHTTVHERGLTIAKTPDGFKLQPRPTQPRPVRPAHDRPDGAADPPSTVVASSNSPRRPTHRRSTDPPGLTNAAA